MRVIGNFPQIVGDDAYPDIMREFFVLRGYAINQYANLERELCGLLQHLMEVDSEVAQIVFFKITSTRTRSEILDKLYKRKFKTEYRIYWNSLLKHVGALDQRRNEIVHWASVAEYKEGGAGISHIELEPPARTADAPYLTKDDLVEFAGKCTILAGECLNFKNLALGAWDWIFEGGHQPSLDKFQQAITYPHPESPRRSRSATTPQSPPQASPPSLPRKRRKRVE